MLLLLSDEKAISFTSFILLDNYVEVCDENAGEDENLEISAQEIEPTVPTADKSSRARLLALVIFSQTSAEVDCKFNEHH